MSRAKHSFDRAMQSGELGDGRFAARTASPLRTWSVGGVIAAALMQSALGHPFARGDPWRSRSTSPVPVADGSYDIAAQPTRTHRSTQHWSIVVTQADRRPAVGR